LSTNENIDLLSKKRNWRRASFFLCVFFVFNSDKWIEKQKNERKISRLFLLLFTF